MQIPTARLTQSAIQAVKSAALADPSCHVKFLPFVILDYGVEGTKVM